MEAAISKARSGLLALELALIAAIFWGDAAGYVPLSKTPFVLLIGWASLRVRGLRWRDVGLCLTQRWPRLVAIGIAWGIGMWLLEFYVTMPALDRLLGYGTDLSTFNEVAGNAKVLAVYLVASWILAALGEEMAWRGYALPRIAEFCGGGMRAWVLALVIVNVAFGLAHLYQGWNGVIQATVGGVLLGVLYLVTGRNLLAPIVAHGLGNSLDFILMYLGLYPGVGN
jgi:membrane protease YdiL (CAAX protease family)